MGEGETHRVLQPRDFHILHRDAHHSVIQDLPHLVVLLFGAARAELSWQHSSPQLRGAASSTCWWLAWGRAHTLNMPSCWMLRTVTTTRAAWLPRDWNTSRGRRILPAVLSSIELIVMGPCIKEQWSGGLLQAASHSAASPLSGPTSPAQVGFTEQNCQEPEGRPFSPVLNSQGADPRADPRGSPSLVSPCGTRSPGTFRPCESLGTGGRRAI